LNRPESDKYIIESMEDKEPVFNIGKSRYKRAIARQKPKIGGDY
jgi:hypothetical protein